MLDFMKSWNPQTYAAMRMMTGALYLCHGLSKLFNFPAPTPAEAPAAIIYTAGPLELICGTLVAVGFLTRPAAFLASGTMAVAYFVGHASGGFFPLVNGGELAALYCFVFLFISARGAGIWSIDGGE